MLEHRRKGGETMYIRYLDQNSDQKSIESIVVRDVRWFCINPRITANDEVDGFCICDDMVNKANVFGNALVEYLACFLLDGDEKVFPGCRVRKDVLPIGDGDGNFELAWFESQEAALSVLEKICLALDAGKQFFDLTQYGADGKYLGS